MNILITGAGSGIGLATAQYLLSHGHNVSGTSRRQRNVGFPIYTMEASDASSVSAAISAAIRDMEHVDALICCAGLGLGGALEDFSPEQLCTELTVNTTGAALAIRAILPHMRANGFGRILCIGSVAGHIAIPFQSMYSASKAAIGSMTDALRLELRGSGVQACTIEPGDTRTEFTSARQFAAGIPKNIYYQAACERALNAMMYDEQHGKPPETVARAIYRALRRRRMPARIVVGASYKALVLAARLLPHAIVEYVLSLLYLRSKKDGGFRY